MRVVAGSLGGRVFETPKGHRTHPMSEKIRGALFDALGDITGLTILDAFAGSGGVSIEAISRGAALAVALDNDPNAHTTLKLNVSALGIAKQVEIIKANAKSWSNRHPHAIFDIVVCDPPYDDVQFKIIEKLTRHIKSNGLMVLSLPPSARIILGDNFKLVSEKSYGDSTLVFHRRVS